MLNDVYTDTHLLISHETEIKFRTEKDVAFLHVRTPDGRHRVTISTDNPVLLRQLAVTVLGAADALGQPADPDRVR